MAQAAARSESFGGMESFAALLEETLGTSDSLEGTVVKGRVISIENDNVLIDVGLKSEGRVALKEFGGPGGNVELKAGDTVEVYLERMEDKNGEAVLSREKAKREEAWTLLEKSFNDQSRVTGVIFGRVKGGFTVDLSGAVAFLPGSQVDIRPVRDISPLLGRPSRSRSSRWTARAVTSWCPAAPCSKRAAPRPGPNWSPTSRKARFSRASSRTSPITARSSIWAVWTVCCTSPTSRGAASTIRRKPSRLARPSRFRSSASTRKPIASASA